MESFRVKTKIHDIEFVREILAYDDDHFMVEEGEKRYISWESFNRAKSLFFISKVEIELVLKGDTLPNQPSKTHAIRQANRILGDASFKNKVEHIYEEFYIYNKMFGL